MKTKRTLTVQFRNHAKMYTGLVAAFLCTQRTAAAPTAQGPLPQEQLKFAPGDVLLIPLNCYVCNAIERETGVPYSHSVVVANSGSSPSEIFVYEAFGQVGRTALTEIQKRAEKKHPLFHLRPVEFAQKKAPTEEQLAEAFKENFLNTSFDDQFLWNNYDEKNLEKLYCSEFVVKLINLFLNEPQTTEPMNFNLQLPFWEKYYDQFNMQVPQNEPGVSPATLYSSSRFLKLGAIQY